MGASLMERGAQWRGLALAVVSAATFATSGVLASSLLRAGWTSGAAVTARVGVAALVLTIPALRGLRGRWGDLQRQVWPVLGFGAFGVSLCQLCYFNALGRLSVGVALLIEYSGIVLIVLYLWLRHGHRPRPLTIGGTLAALAGLVLVLNVAGGAHVDPVGVLWGAAAAVCLAFYFVISARTDDALPPLTMAWAGLTIGAVGLGALALVGAVPWRVGTGDVLLAGHRTSVLVPVLGIALVATVVAYLAGIAAARSLGAKLGSFVALTEVLFAIGFAWLFLSQLPTGVQLAGGALVLVGVALVRADELRAPTVHAEAAVPVEVP